MGTNEMNRTQGPFEQSNHKGKTFYRPASAAHDADTINSHMSDANKWSSNHMYRTSTHDMKFRGHTAVKEKVPLK